MKTHCFKLSDRITIGKRVLTAAACLFSGVLTSSATVTPQGWWHYGEGSDIYADSTANAYRFGSAFSCAGTGQSGAYPEPGFGCGGPLGTTGWTSTSALYWTPDLCGDAAMWDPANASLDSSSNPGGVYNPPGSNYVIECWLLPIGTGCAGGGPPLGDSGSSCHFFESGSTDFGQDGGKAVGLGGGGVYFMINNNANGAITNEPSVSLLSAWVVGNANEGVPNDVQIGTYVPLNDNAWTHVAVVNFGGTNNTFFINGETNGYTTSSTIPNGNIGAGSGTSGTGNTYRGYLDELRISTFAPGAFTTNDLLLRPLTPDVIAQPVNESVWNGGAAPFDLTVAYDSSTVYQWQSGGNSIENATNSELYLNVVTSGSNAAVYNCVLTNSAGGPVTSSNATLTVVSPNLVNVSAYQSNVLSTPGLVSYYTVDNDTGSTLTDVKSGNDGQLEGSAEYDGRTNTTFGVRALRLQKSLDGDATIPNIPAYDFGNNANQSGTIEMLVYLEANLSANNETLIAEASPYVGVGNPTYYEIQTTPGGNALFYQSDASTEPVSWAVPNFLLNRQAYVAVVFTNGTVTAYVDGLSLGTQTNVGFGSSSGYPLWLGSSGGLGGPDEFSGELDEVAIYTNALTASTIAIHNSKFVFGTNTSQPSVTALNGTNETLYAGGLVNFTVTAAGTPPLSYQWTSNSVPIAGATGSSLTLNPSTTNMSATYDVMLMNPYGSTNGTAFTVNFVVPTNKYVAMVMHDNPMALWQLDETNGPTVYDSVSGHNGSYSNSSDLTFGVSGMPGISNTAVQFGGGGYATIPNSPLLSPSTAFSVECWCNPANENGWCVGASQYRGGPAREGWALYGDFNYNSFETQVGNASGVSWDVQNGYNPLPGSWYLVDVVWDGAGHVYLYTEGVTVGEATSSASFVPNAINGLFIGIREDLNEQFTGEIQDFALYNYALSAEQISNHWSAQFQASQVTQQPVGVTNVEGSTVTLTAQASGYPNTYQWFFNGNALSATPNFDGTAHYPNGVTGTSLVIAEAQPSDSGTYFMAVTNPIEGSVSSNATVLITPNTVPPTVSEVIPLGTPNTFSGITNPYLVKVVFSGRVDPNSGGNTVNYSFSPALTINQMSLLGSGANDVAAAKLGADYRVAILDTAGMTPGQKYTLTIAGVKDQSETPLTVPTTNFSFYAPVMTPGLVNWDYYYLGSDPSEGTVSALIGDVNYPNAPMTNTDFTAFDSDQITGGDLNNNPAFGGLGDNYGDVVSGWITPTVSGDYTFFLWSDDGSELDMSPDANPNNLAPIALEAAAGSGFTEPTNTPDVDSAPITLVAGHSYFIRTLHAEGSGGDYVKVAWRISTDSTPAKNLTPIPGTYLSTFAISTPKFSTPTLTNGILTLNWSGLGTTIQASTNLLDWTNVPGNPSPLVVPVNSGTNALYFRLSQ